jgi:hypothetical protein
MIVYVAGPYSAPTPQGVDANIQQARQAAIALWREGHVAICPHLNTAHFEDECPGLDFVKGDLEILSRCDALVMLPGWEQSKGARRELEFATERDIPVCLLQGQWPEGGIVLALGEKARRDDFNPCGKTRKAAPTRTATDRGAAITPTATREKIAEIVASDDRISESAMRDVLAYVDSRCQAVAGKRLKTAPCDLGFAIPELRRAIRKSGPDFLDRVERCAIAAGESSEAVFTVSGFFAG